MAKQKLPKYPIGGFAKDSFGFPHYENIQKANLNWQKTYTTELANRAEIRSKLRGSPQNSKWRLQIKKARAKLEKLFNLKPIQKVNVFTKPKIGFKTQFNLPSGEISFTEFSFEFGESEISFTQIFLSASKTNKNIIFAIPSTGPGYTKLQTPQDILKNNPFDLSENVLIVPHFKSLCDFSSTQNKGLIIQGRSQIGLMIAELYELMNAYLAHYRKDTNSVFLYGNETGGLIAILAGALIKNLSGVIVTQPEVIASAITPESLMVPHLNKNTDLSEILSMNCDYHPILLINAKKYPILKYPKIKYVSGKSEKFIETFLNKNGHQKKWASIQLKPVKLNHRLLNISKIQSKSEWANHRKKIKQTFLDLCHIPKKLKPIKVTQVGQSKLSDCLRTEYHVQTTSNSIVNLTFYQPFPIQKRETIMCLPGSGSDVAKLESQYVHEVIANGWNAVSIDARVRLYDFHPNIPEDSSMISQSIIDLLVCCDWVFNNKMINPKKVATMGVSQGGSHSWMLAALEERICAAAPVCGICTYESVINEQVNEYYNGNGRSFLDSHSIYYYIPYMLNYADQQDLCALIAPRPLKPICADHDDCFPINGVKEAGADLKKLYQLLGVPKNLEYTIFNGPHSMPLHTRVMAYNFIKKCFNKIKDT